MYSLYNKYCAYGNNGIILLYGIRTVKNSNLLYTQRVKLKKKTIKKNCNFFKPLLHLTGDITNCLFGLKKDI